MHYLYKSLPDECIDVSVGIGVGKCIGVCVVVPVVVVGPSEGWASITCRDENNSRVTVWENIIEELN